MRMSVCFLQWIYIGLDDGLLKTFLSQMCICVSQKYCLRWLVNIDWIITLFTLKSNAWYIWDGFYKVDLKDHTLLTVNINTGGKLLHHKMFPYELCRLVSMWVLKVTPGNVSIRVYVVHSWKHSLVYSVILVWKHFMV